MPPHHPPHRPPMFVRLDAPLPRLPRCAPTKLLYRFGKTVASRFHGVSYFAVGGEVEALLLGILPEAVRPYFLCSYMVVNHHDVPPHIDNGIRLSLNYYVQTAGATTTFYRFKSAQVEVEKLDNNEPGSPAGLYSRQNLEVVGSFTAGPHELWALDVSQPHDVVGDAGAIDREAYCLQSRSVGFKELLDWVQR